MKTLCFHEQLDAGTENLKNNFIFEFEISSDFQTIFNS